MSRQGQPTRRTYNIPFSNKRLSCAGRALRPRSGGSSAPRIAHSRSVTSPRAKASLQKEALSQSSSPGEIHYVNRA